MPSRNIETDLTMVDPTDAKELIDEAIDEAERVDRAERAIEKRFRDRVSVLVGIFAVSLAIIHVAAAGNGREAVLKTVEASDTYNYMQAKIIRESILRTAAQDGSVSSASRAAMIRDANKLRNPDKAGYGIVQLQPKADNLRAEGETASTQGEWYELAETALQVAIVLLSVAMVARSLLLVGAASTVAAFGVLLAVITFVGV